jgi:hypothetical protein
VWTSEPASLSSTVQPTRPTPPGQQGTAECGSRSRPAPRVQLWAAGLLLLAVGLGCGQLSAITTVQRDESGSHSGTWEVDLSLDEQVFNEVQRLSAEPIDLEYRASLLDERGWQGQAHPTGLSARRSFDGLEEINREDNPLVMFFAGEGQAPEENPFRKTAIEVDESDPDAILYKYSAQVYVPNADPDELMDEIVLSLSQGQPNAIAPTDVDRLKAAMEAAGPFALSFGVTLPGEIDPQSIRPDGKLTGPSTVSWRLDTHGSYLLEAESTLRPGEVPASVEKPVAGQPSDENAAPGGASSGGAGGLLEGKTRVQVLGSIILAGLGAYILYSGAKGVITVSATALGPWAMVLIGGAALVGAVAAWNYGPPPKPPDPFAVFTEPTQENSNALMKASLGGFSAEEAAELAVKLETLSPEQKQAVATELGVDYTTLYRALVEGTYKELLKP